jgi:hypothetical protein
MCPFCLASMGLMVGSLTSVGGLTALAVKLSRKKSNREAIPSPKERSTQNVNSNSR